MKTQINPFFIDGSAGRLFAIHHRPANNEVTENVLFVPSFSEEMNRCRSMVTMTSMELAKRGIGVLILDLFGTGDSEGEYEDASWDQWVDDIFTGLDWINSQKMKCQTLWGVRTGALLAAEVVRKKREINHLILWQPVTSGKNYFTQFLRIRIAADINKADGVKTTKELLALLEEGRDIEVSGYLVPPTIADKMMHAKLSDIIDCRSERNIDIDWFEIMASTNQNLPMATKKTVERFNEAGINSTLHVVKGAPFWQLHERTVVPELVTVTGVLGIGDLGG